MNQYLFLCANKSKIKYKENDELYNLFLDHKPYIKAVVINAPNYMSAWNIGNKWAYQNDFVCSKMMHHIMKIGKYFDMTTISHLQTLIYPVQSSSNV